MKHEPPARAGRPRSDAAARLAALIAGLEADPASGDAAAPDTGAVAESGAPAPASGLVVDGRPPAAPPPVARPVAPAPRPAPVRAPAATAVESPPASPSTAGVGAARGTAVARPEVSTARRPRRGRSRLAGVAFGIAVVVLVAAIPVLGIAGARTILHSRGGTVSDATTDPADPGYLATVEPTPTALVVQRDGDGAPTAVTLVALGNGEAGGSVVFVPIDTNLPNAAFLIDRLRTAYTKGSDPTFVSAAGSLLNVGFDSVVNLDDAAWEQLVAPVAPLQILNPTTVEAGGTTIPAGPVSLEAAQVGPYLAATAPDQDDLDRMERHKIVWQAWLNAVKASGSQDAVPNTTTGLGPYARTLANGVTSMDTLAVVPAAKLSGDGFQPFDVEPAAMRIQLTDAVPAPVSPKLGARYSVRLLNGVAGEPVPENIIRRLVFGGAQIDAIGNAKAFGQERTTIEYHEPNRKPAAQAVKFLLGAGEIKARTRTNDPVDIVIVLGKDAMAHADDPIGPDDTAGATGG